MENIDNKVVFKSKVVSAEIVKEEKTTNVEKDTGSTEQESINRESDSSMTSGCVVGDVEEFTTTEPTNGELRKVLVFTLNEKISRPRSLNGTTYKLSIPNTVGNSVYLTVNYYTVDENTDTEQRYPYEVFISTLVPSQHLTFESRLITSILRKGMNLDFVIDDMCKIMEPGGGYYSERKYYPSIISHLGHTLKEAIMNIKEFNNEIAANLASKQHVNTSPENKKTTASNLKQNTSNDLEYLDELNSNSEPGTLSWGDIKGKAAATPPACADCGSHNITKSSGCLTCNDCGYSYCG